MGFGWFVWVALGQRSPALLATEGSSLLLPLFTSHQEVWQCYRPCMHGAAQAKYRVSGHGGGLRRRLLGGGIDMPGAHSVVKASVPGKELRPVRA
jgi:hypothetical protein